MDRNETISPRETARDLIANPFAGPGLGANEYAGDGRPEQSSVDHAPEIGRVRTLYSLPKTAIIRSEKAAFVCRSDLARVADVINPKHIAKMKRIKHVPDFDGFAGWLLRRR